METPNSSASQWLLQHGQTVINVPIPVRFRILQIAGTFVAVRHLLQLTQLTQEPTMGPQHLPVADKDERDRDQQCAEDSQQRTRPPCAQVFVQRLRGEREE